VNRLQVAAASLFERGDREVGQRVLKSEHLALGDILLVS
jgi:hypothetical protein